MYEFVTYLLLSAQSEGCVAEVARREMVAVQDFDRQNDRVNGNSISCAIAMLPRDVERDLFKIRDAVERQNLVLLSTSFEFPFWLKIGDESPVQVSALEFPRYAPRVASFLRTHVGCIELRDLRLHGQRGASLVEGKVWMNSIRNPEGSLELKITALAID